MDVPSSSGAGPEAAGPSTASVTSASAKSQRVTVAFCIPCGSTGTLKGETYHYKQAQTKLALGRRFWHLRWIVHFLGGHSSRNFLAGSLPTFRNKLFSTIWPRWTDTEEKLQEEVQSHFLQSSYSQKKQEEALAAQQTRKRKATSQDIPAGNEDQDASDTDMEQSTGGMTDQADVAGPLDTVRPGCTEFATSTFAMLTLLNHWQQGTRKDAKWKKPLTHVSNVAGQLLQSMVSLFLTEEQSFTFWWDDRRLTLTFVGGSLDVETVTKEWTSLEKTLSKDRSGFLQVLEDVSYDCTRRTIGQKRKEASLRLKCHMLEALAQAVDSSDNTHSCWSSLNLKQIMQLRTSLGCRFRYQISGFARTGTLGG